MIVVHIDHIKSRQIHTLQFTRNTEICIKFVSMYKPIESITYATQVCKSRSHEFKTTMYHYQGREESLHGIPVANTLLLHLSKLASTTIRVGNLGRKRRNIVVSRQQKKEGKSGFSKSVVIKNMDCCMCRLKWQKNFTILWITVFGW